MYIVRQDNVSIVNSKHITLYCIEDRESTGDYDFAQEKPYRIMISCIGLLQSVLGYYDNWEAANSALQQLLSALQDGKNIFYMPQS